MTPSLEEFTRADRCVKQKLLFISRKWPPAVGGMETYSVELVAALERDFEVTRLVLPGRADGRPPKLLSYGIFVLRAMFYCLFFGRRFSHLVLGDLVLFPAAILCRFVRKDQRRVVVVYGLDLVYGRRQGLLPRCYGLYLSMFRACQGLFVRVVAISRYTAQLAEDSGLRHVAVVNPSLPSSPLTRPAETVVELPPAFLQAKRRILQFGRLVPRKGALWFAQHVLPLLPQEAEFFVAGSAHGYSQLADLEACERTHYLGPLPPEMLAAMIRAADAVVMPNIPSRNGVPDVEGFGLVAVETSSLGGLLIASRFQGLEDAVLEGVTGNLAPPGDAAAWRAAIGTLLAESSGQGVDRRVHASKTTRAHYSRERMGNEFVRCFAPLGEEGNHDDAEGLRSSKSVL